MELSVWSENYLKAWLLSICCGVLLSNITGSAGRAYRMSRRQDPSYGLGLPCDTNSDCGEISQCSPSRICLCRDGYFLNRNNSTCLAGLRLPCKYDDSCVPNAYCHRQERCECKEDFYPTMDLLHCSNVYSVNMADDDYETRHDQQSHSEEPSIKTNEKNTSSAVFHSVIITLLKAFILYTISPNVKKMRVARKVALKMGKDITNYDRAYVESI